jgi:hypothetical protein
MLKSGIIRHQLFLGAALAVVLFGAYMLTYRGIPISGDEIFLFDNTESLTRRGNFDRNYEFYSIRPGEIAEIGQDGRPWPFPKQEPMAAIVQVPIFWVAQALPNVGTMHVVWLSNIFVTILTAISVYIIGLRQGYSPQLSWLGALLFGVATIAWVYSRLLFREPIMAFFMLWTFAFAIETRQQWCKDHIPWRLIILMVLFFIGAVLTKAVSILLAPALFIILLPDLTNFRRHRRLAIRTSIISVVVFAIGIFIIDAGIDSDRYSLASQIRHFRDIEWEYILESVLGYQISFGRSIWLYSPVLLLGLWGAYLLMKRGDWRWVASISFSIFAFSLWYGFALQIHWMGGWGWGPRYYVPLIPITMLLWVFPALEYIGQQRQHWMMGLVAVLAALGIGLQVLGMSVWLSNYYTDLYRNGLIYEFDNFVLDKWHWMDGTWTVKWSPIYYHLDRFDFNFIDIAWRYADSPALTLGLASGLTIVGSFAAYWLSRRKTLSVTESYWAAGMSIILLTMTFGTLATGLHSIKNDPRLTDGQPDVVALVEKLNEEVPKNDVVFIDREEYTEIFMNYFKPSALVATLPYASSERYGPEEPLVSSDAPIEEQIGSHVVYALDWSADHYDALWLIASSSPFQPEKIRPVEHYLAEHYFPVHEVGLEGIAFPRAIQFLTTDAPMGEPAMEVDAKFGDALLLNGIDFPAGTTFSTGDGIPISFRWEPISSIDFNYNIGIYLVGPDGVVTDRNGQPQGTFGNMMQWEVGEMYRDNHGLILPNNAPSGQYQLLLAVYNWQDGQRLTVVADSMEVIDNALLLTTITVK